MLKEGGVVRTLSIVFELTKTVIALTVVVLLIHFFIGTIFIVDGSSMYPTLKSGQLLWVNKIAYLTQKPQRGDIVVLRFPGDPAKDKYVKRIIGLPGDTVDVKNGHVYINNQQLVESYLDKSVVTGTDTYNRVVLGPKEYFLMGDNRPNSSDSRIWGQARREDLIGRTQLILYPFSDFGYAPKIYYKF